MSDIILQTGNLNVFYGKMIHALKEVSIEVEKGKIIAILGSNGAGKTTLLKTISGILKAESGYVRLNGENILGIPAYKLLGKGLAHVPEGRMIISNFTVKENLLAGGYITDQKTLKDNMEKVLESFPILKSRLSQIAGTMSGGEQQMVVIGRALMSNPKVLLLDEPSLGLDPIMVDKVMEMVQQVNKTQNITVILVEQNAYLALEVADRAYVLENGYITMDGPSKELMNNEDLKKKYLAG